MSKKNQLPKVSVLTVYKRPEGEVIVGKCLDNQTFTDFEWVIVTPEPVEKVRKEASTPFIYVPEPPIRKGETWHLNRAYNYGLRQCRGELVVSIQDEIWFPDDALNKFWFNYQRLGNKSCISGVGDIYMEEDSFGKPILKVWADPRKKEIKNVYECFPNDLEFNFCAVPLKGMYEIGGFDEGLDMLGYGMDNVSVSERLDALGYKFYLDQSNECRGLKQSRATDWDEKHTMHGAYKIRMGELLQADGTYKKLDYL